MADNCNDKQGQRSEPVVSVVMPAYNSARFIERAIKSVLEQEIPLELIIVVDASTDGTKDVILSCRQSCERSDVIWKVVFHEAKTGVAESRNEGVNRAAAPYIAFLDSDDWWEPGKLERQIALMERTHAPLCSTARAFVRADGTKTGRVIPVSERITYNMLLHGNCINCSSVVIRTEIAREFPMGHDECHEDYITWLQVLKKYGAAYAINEPLLCYRRSEGTKSSNKLKSAKMHYRSLRRVGIGPCRALWYFCFYAIKGVIKHV